MHTDFLSYGSSRISYTLYGSGPQLLLCFHGYGESAASFAFLEKALGADCTLLAIDLPYHGQTQWREGLWLAPSLLLSLIGEIVARLPPVKPRWWLMGYSMGGRVALQVLEMTPDKIEKVVLIAPDGLKMNRWYWLATQTHSGNRLFGWTMQRPGWLFFVLRAGNTLRLVNPGIYKFAIRYITDDCVRQELYQRWTVLRGFRPDTAALRALITSKKIPVKLLYGRFDHIIRWQTGEHFRKGAPEAYIELILLPSGHQLLQSKNEEVLVSLLK